MIEHMIAIERDDCNKELDSMEIAIDRILKRLLLDNQTDRVKIDKENKIIKIDLNKKEECVIKYEIKIHENLIKEYSKEKIILRTPELHNK